MAFWSSQTLEKRLDELVSPPNKDLVDCNAITLRVGREHFVTPHIDEAQTKTKKSLADNESFLIPPQQFAVIVTEEKIIVPKDAMAFISMKSTFKLQGLINVSGFHVDPGWEGYLTFAVYNAGPSPVHLQQGLPLFLIWYADLDASSDKHKTGSVGPIIPPDKITALTNPTDSLYVLDKRLKEEVEERRSEDRELTDRLHRVERNQERVIVTAAVAITLLASLAVLAMRESLFGTSDQRQATPAENAQAPPLPPLPQTSEEQRVPEQ